MRRKNRASVAPTVRNGMHSRAAGHERVAHPVQRIPQRRVDGRRGRRLVGDDLDGHAVAQLAEDVVEHRADVGAGLAGQACGCRLRVRRGRGSRWSCGRRGRRWARTWCAYMRALGGRGRAATCRTSSRSCTGSLSMVARSPGNMPSTKRRQMSWIIVSGRYSLRRRTTSAAVTSALSVRQRLAAVARACPSR